jgi:hypothetical protein
MQKDKAVEAERIRALKRTAWDAGDLALFEFFNGIEYELTRLRAVGRVVAAFYQRGGIDDAGWNTLFESLFDAGLLNDSDKDEESSEPAA